MTNRLLTGLLLLAACAGEADDIDRTTAALTSATWTGMVNVSAVGNDLTNTAPTSGWNAGAVSVQRLVSDGYVEFTTGELSNKIAGLSSNANSFAEVDFGIRLNSSGQAWVVEDGVRGGSLGPYTPASRFRVQVEGGVVTYWKNGVLKYTSTEAPSFPLWVDVGLSSPGATINDVVLETLDLWQNTVGVTVDGNDISKSSGLSGWNAGATSIATIASGDGHVQFTTGENTTGKIAGLSNGNSSQGYADIDFGIMLNDGGFAAVYEGGTLVDNSGPYAAGDVFQVRVTGGVVSYWKNGFQFYTSASAPTYPLLLDSSIKTPGATILDAAIWAGAPADCTPERQILLGDGPSERFGIFDLAGDVMAVGDLSGGVRVASVFRRSGDQWLFEQDLLADASYTSHIATDGETIAAVSLPNGATQQVAAIYRHDGDQWVSEDLLQPCPEDEMGFTSVAVDGDVIAFGVELSVVDGEEAGRVYIYRRSTGGTWILEAILTHDDFRVNGRNFYAVAVRGDWLIGASLYEAHAFRYKPTLPDPPQPPSCALLHPGKWEFRQTMAPADIDYPRLESIDLSASGKRLVLGDRNKVYVFERAAGVWSQAAMILAYPPWLDTSMFVALGGPDPDGASIIAAAARVYVETATGWSQVDVQPGTGSRGVSADQILVGDTLDDTGGTDVGAIHVLDFEPACLPE